LTGVEGKECTFLFTDTQIIKEQFLEDINSLLNSGEVPNMWEPEEKKQILDSTRDYNTKIGRIDEPDVIYQTFVERVRNNLHIVLCMSPVGD
jgi:dynein heavy chain, axonemal